MIKEDGQITSDLDCIKQAVNAIFQLPGFETVISQGNKHAKRRLITTKEAEETDCARQAEKPIFIIPTTNNKISKKLLIII